MWGAVAAVLIALCGGVARAGETFPSEVRTITATGATSPCIGDPKTPVCAVETFLACSARQDKSLCLRVGVERSRFQLPPHDLHYHILSMRILRAEDIPPDLRDTYWMKPGYADILLFELPNATLKTCPSGCTYSYNARPVGGEWQIVAWSMWGLDD